MLTLKPNGGDRNLAALRAVSSWEMMSEGGAWEGYYLCPNLALICHCFRQLCLPVAPVDTANKRKNPSVLVSQPNTHWSAGGQVGEVGYSSPAGI